MVADSNPRHLLVAIENRIDLLFVVADYFIEDQNLQGIVSGNYSQEVSHVNLSHHARRNLELNCHLSV